MITKITAPPIPAAVSVVLETPKERTKPHELAEDYVIDKRRAYNDQ